MARECMSRIWKSQFSSQLSDQFITFCEKALNFLDLSFPSCDIELIIMLIQLFANCFRIFWAEI